MNPIKYLQDLPPEAKPFVILSGAAIGGMLGAIYEGKRIERKQHQLVDKCNYLVDAHNTVANRGNFLLDIIKRCEESGDPIHDVVDEFDLIAINDLFMLMPKFQEEA